MSQTKNVYVFLRLARYKKEKEQLFSYLNKHAAVSPSYSPGGRGMSVWLGLLLGLEDQGRGRAPGGGPEARGPGIIIIVINYYHY